MNVPRRRFIAPNQTVTYNFDVIKTTDPVRIALDDLSLRADVVGEITLYDGSLLAWPAPIIRAGRRNRPCQQLLSRCDLGQGHWPLT